MVGDLIRSFCRRKRPQVSDLVKRLEHDPKRIEKHMKSKFVYPPALPHIGQIFQMRDEHGIFEVIIRVRRLTKMIKELLQDLLNGLEKAEPGRADKFLAPLSDFIGEPFRLDPHQATHNYWNSVWTQAQQQQNTPSLYASTILTGGQLVSSRF